MGTWDKDKMRVWMRERRKQRRSQGLCVSCGGTQRITSYQCQKCLDILAKHNKARRLQKLKETATI